MADGVGAWVVDGMIRRSVRSRFHNVWWRPPAGPLPQPCVIVANHHGWHDGYVMYLAAKALGLPALMWIQEYDAFPLFGAVGGLPFPVDDASRRAATIRKTIRALEARERTLVLFPEGVLHRPPGLLPFGESLEMLRAKVRGLAVVPVAIRYELSMHERPECWVEFGERGGDLGSLVDGLGERVATGEEFELLQAGTKDVNERWDMRRLTGRG